MQSTLDEHAHSLGKVIANLSTLELSLRVLLYNKEVKENPSLAIQRNLTALKINDLCTVNAFTNYDTLGELISKYNSLITSIDSALCIDKKVVELRDAFAHGRVLASMENDTFILLKFSQPKSNSTKVTYAQPLTKEWMAIQIKRLHDEVHKLTLAEKLI